LVASFFFSSRRRHTRSKRDWSSDVCSSDLESGIALHIHQLDKVSGDGNNLARSLIDHRNFHPRIDWADQALLLACENAHRDNSRLGRAMLPRLRLFKLNNTAGFAVNNHVLANLEFADINRLAHEIQLNHRLHLKDFPRTIRTS